MIIQGFRITRCLSLLDIVSDVAFSVFFCSRKMWKLKIKTSEWTSVRSAAVLANQVSTVLNIVSGQIYMTDDRTLHMCNSKTFSRHCGPWMSEVSFHSHFRSRHKQENPQQASRAKQGGGSGSPWHTFSVLIYMWRCTTAWCCVLLPHRGVNRGLCRHFDQRLVEISWSDNPSS